MINKNLKVSILAISAIQKTFGLTTLAFLLMSISCTKTPKIIGPDGYSVTITSPFNGAFVSKILTLYISVSDVENTKKVELFVDGNTTGVTDETHPFNLKWNTRDQANAEYSIKVRAYNLNNQAIDSESIKVNIFNLLELNRVLYKNNSFLISWPKSHFAYFHSYVLYEAFLEDLSDAQQIYTTSSRDITSFTVTGVAEDEFRYYRLVVLNRNGIEIEAVERRGSSYINIAFVSYREGNYEIYIMDIDGENQTNLTNHKSSDINPVFSPDGSKIAFSSDRDGADQWSLFMMDIDGSNQTKIVENLIGMPKFSPDGSKIVYVGLIDGIHNIFLIDSDGTDKARLTNRLALDSDPQFFSDGSKIVYHHRDSRSDSDIFIMDIDGSNQIKLSNDGSALIPTLSPDNLKIAFNSSSYGPSLKIIMMANDGSNPTRISPRGEVDDAGPIFSPDGSKILFVSHPTQRSEDFNIYVMDIDGSNRINLSNSLGGNFHPQFSSDGSQVVFTSWRNRFGDIYRVNVDGADLTNLTNYGGVDERATFQPRD